MDYGTTANYGTIELTNSYTYYKNGLKKTFTGPAGATYAYTYDDNNQLTGVNIPGAGYITYSSYKWNRPTEVILPGGGKREYAYDPLMRVKSIAGKDPAQNIFLNYQYNYDKMDNITAKATEHGEYGYGYDDLYRLTGADNPVQADEGFTYDAVGNRLTAAGVADDWSYNNNNELQSYDNVAFEYDANGNMTKKTDAGQVAIYIYNVEDRLERVEDGFGSLISSYYYDPFGRRLWKEVNGVKTYFVYADEGLVAEADAAGNVVKSYGYRPGSTWTTDPLFMREGSQYYFYQNDHLGTPQKLTAVNGAVVWSAKYSSFGEADVDPTSSVTNNLRFPGQYYDDESDLNYNWNRYYSAVSGRYNRKDPIGIEGGINFFIYADVNPIKYTDPYGLITCGSGWNEPIVPDNPFGFPFSNCCVGHDSCYGTCGETKANCDNNFEQCMLDACDRMSSGRPIRKSVCKTWAKRYAWFVKTFGKSAFNSAQKNARNQNRNQQIPWRNP